MVEISGYEFGGWYTDSNFTNAATSWFGGEIGDKTLYAKWNPISYTIFYEVNEGTLSGSQPLSYNIECNVVLPTSSEITRSGFSFAGWYSDANFSGTAVTGWSAGEKSGDITLYAKWVVNSVVTPSYPEVVEPEFEITTANYIMGTGLSYAVTYSGGEDTTYQWFLDGELMTGATSPNGTYSVSLEPGYYSLVVVITEGSNQYSKERIFQVTN